MTKRCDDCLFAAEILEETWECRYYPPMPAVERDRHWRLVKSDFWCSKHESRKLQKELKEMYRPTPVSDF